MKIKYYLRGLGTGILFSTIILTIAFAVRNSDNKTVENDETTSESRVQVETETNEEEITTDSETNININEIIVSIKSGMSSEDVSELFASQGIVENQEEFDSYLKDNGYSKTIVVGDYSIVPGLTYKEIAEIITNTN